MDENNLSAFHDGSDKQGRKNLLKREIHMVNQNLLGYYQTNSGELEGYKIKFENLNNLFVEINQNLQLDEEKSCNKLRNLIDNFLLVRPLYSPIVNHGINSRKTTTKFNFMNWEELRKLLFQYQVLIFNLDDKYSADTDNKGNQAEN